MTDNQTFGLQLKKRNKRFLFLVILTILLQTSMMVFFGFLKSGFHVDEIWTFAHSNSKYKPYLYKAIYSDSKITIQEDDFFNTWINGSDYQQYVTLTKEERFNYGSVFYNLSKSVHPPLYHLIIHTLYSFFPGGINKWYGLSLNLLLFLLCQLMLYLVAAKITGSRIVALSCIFLWGFGTSAINNVLFIRMYVLFTLFVLLFIYFSYRLFTSEKHSKGDITGLFLSIFLGSLTQHYFLIYCFFLTYLLAVNLVLLKKYGQLLQLILTTFLGVVFSIIVFPATIPHLFSSYRGQEALGNLAYSYSSNLIYRLYLYFSSIVRELLGFAFPDTRSIITIFTFLLYLLCLIIVFLLIRYLLRKLKDRRNKTEAKITLRSQNHFFLVFLAISIILYIFTIAMISPIMGLYADRYLFCLFPILSFYTVLGIFSIFKSILKNKDAVNVAVFGMIFFFIVMTHLSNDKLYGKIYLYRDTISSEQLVILADANCVIYSEPVHNIHAWANEVSKCNRVLNTFSVDEESTSRILESLGPNQTAYIIIDDDYDRNKILDLYKQNNLFYKSQLLFSGYFSNSDYTIYLIHTSSK